MCLKGLACEFYGVVMIIECYGHLNGSWDRIARLKNNSNFYIGPLLTNLKWCK